MIDHDSAMGRYRIHLPASPVCGRWETMLVDALDQRLSAEDQAFFDQHRAVCANCAALLDQSACGRQWLACLDTAPEPPGDLMDRILRQTGPGLLLATPVPQAAGAVALPLVWQRPVGRLAWLRRLVEPRLVMTAAMAFFSIALTLSLTREQLREVRSLDMNPGSMRAALERRLATASTPVVRYYDHLRFLYEIESRVHEIEHSTEDVPDTLPQKSGSGGSQLVPRSGVLADPHPAPQQTVAPPLRSESEEPVEAILKPSPDIPSSDFSSPDLHSATLEAAVLERSQPCSA